jgi:drug/metabolite transporter (DMT)-like permease
LDTLVFFAVLAAAAMHAGWNAMVKLGIDHYSSIALLTFMQAGISLVLIPFFPLPAQAAWPWLAASAIIHAGYKLFLIRAYEHGELSQIYPLARGSAPVLTALVSVLYLGEAFPAQKLVAIGCIAGGVLLMSLRGGSDLRRMPPQALIWALGTACFTAAYTIVDGIGARLSGTPSAYTFWMFAGDGFFILLWTLHRRGRTAFAAMQPVLMTGFVAGALSLFAYWVVIWAFTQAPIALVAALRETSVLFAMLFGIFLLKERATWPRWVAAALIVAGVILIRL